MLKFFGFLCVFVVIFSCNSSEKRATIIDGTKTYEVYKGSEMTTLMKAMYAYNLQLKKDIKLGKTPTEFPREFLNIHTAELSDSKSRNETFEQFSGQFIDAEQLVFIEDSQLSVTERYNNAINLCLSCHKTECTGPIPKIKKLLIK
ncbi:hypothetical protein A9Q87_06965 [Flavobacteriales bacterium 34_180_T64]|nr:hypothetical protein A9Q87_06965 [Flavobacteriales bacterium 34_180_T64]